jgi:hypothetical protein
MTPSAASKANAAEEGATVVGKAEGKTVVAGKVVAGNPAWTIGLPKCRPSITPSAASRANAEELPTVVGKAEGKTVVGKVGANVVGAWTMGLPK